MICSFFLVLGYKRLLCLNKKRGCLKSTRQPRFIWVGDGNNFRLSDSQSVHFSFETTSFFNT